MGGFVANEIDYPRRYGHLSCDRFNGSGESDRILLVLPYSARQRADGVPLEELGEALAQRPMRPREQHGGLLEPLSSQ